MESFWLLLLTGITFAILFALHHKDDGGHPSNVSNSVRGTFNVVVAFAIRLSRYGTGRPRLEVLLSELETLLIGYNYAVFLRIYPVPFNPDASVEWYVAKALGSRAIVDRALPVTGPDFLAEVETALRYAGETTAGPIPAILASRRFAELLSSIRVELERLIDGAHLLAQFWLCEGHPAYPVFWDFAFVIASPEGGFVLIGSSSD